MRSLLRHIPETVRGALPQTGNEPPPATDFADLEMENLAPEGREPDAIATDPR